MSFYSSDRLYASNNTIKNTLNKVLQIFNSVSLQEMDKVKLMNRVDTKYVLDSNILIKVLEYISNDYFILEINNKRQFPYQSLYYDTYDDVMYKAHHNGKLNRYKIRFRKYIASNDTFLEIKEKIKGIRTIKNRIPVNNIENSLEITSKEFIKIHTPFDPDKLESKLYTNFSRITLVNKQFNERVTIDSNLLFYYNKNNEFVFNNCAIIEFKHDSASDNSKLLEALTYFGVRQNGISKYCLGRALTETDLKRNNFKSKILTLNKIENGNVYYRNISTS